MLQGVPTGAAVVPLESFVEVSCAAYVVSRRIAVTSENINKSSANTLHVDRNGIFRASKNS